VSGLYGFRRRPSELIFNSAFVLIGLTHVAQGFFLGPIAVGLAVGALAVTKGFIIGALLSRKRSHGRHGRSFSYQPRNHYTSSHHTSYTQPQPYYYSSNKYHHRGKRSALPTIAEFSHEEIHRMKREVENFDFDMWTMEMTSKDQDDCSKKVICELSAKYATNKAGMTDNEILLTETFSKRVDVNSGEVQLTLAAQIGTAKGQKRCKELYERCGTSVEDILSMVSMEMEDLKVIEKEVQGLSEGEILADLAAEAEEQKNDLKEAGVDEDRLWD
jgi:hypothetical protein